MVMVPEQVLKGRLTLEDYEQLPNDQDYEIIEGRLYVAPRPRPRHQIVGTDLTVLLHQHVRGRGLGLVVPDADLIVAERHVYISPDIMVFLGERAAAVLPDDWIRILPDLVVEVLSPSTQDYDRTIKRRTYEQLGVPHYWIADPLGRALTECVLDPEGRYQERTVSAPDVFHPELFPELAIDLDKLFG